MMKKISVLFLSLLLLSIVPTVPAAAEDLSFNWEAGEPFGTGASGLSTWTGNLVDGEMATWDGTLSITNPYYGGNFQAVGTYTCTGAEDCLPEVVYVDVTVTVTWSNQRNEGVHSVLISAGEYSSTMLCSGAASKSGSCSVHAALAVPVTDTGQAYYQAVNIILQPGVGDYSYPTTVFAYSASITMSSDPVSPCTDEFDVVDNVVPETAIDPTSSVGSEAVLTVGQSYRLTVGGFWDDGTLPSRTDTAIQLENAGGYVPLYELAADDTTAECVQQDPEDSDKMQVVFTADSTTFAIRANDVEGQFADNDTVDEKPLSYSIDLVTTKAVSGTGGCTGQYLAGPVIGTVTLQANNSTGVSMYQAVGSAKYPMPGAWYIVKVAGTWLNNGTGDPQTGISLKHSTQSSTAWLPADLAPSNGCYDETNATYYMQMTFSGPSMFFRVADLDDNFVSNTGTLTLTFQSVTTFTHYPTGCELNYNVGNLIENKTIQANWVNGWPLDEELPKWDAMGGISDTVTPVRYYMLETYGGPFYTAPGVFSWDMDIAKRGVYVQNGTTSGTYTDGFGHVYPYSTTDNGWYVYQYPDDGLDWYEVHTSPFVECVVPIDTVGHVQLYFALDEQVDLYEFIRDRYALRVRDDGSYTNNTGSISYRLYEATRLQYTNPGTVPETDGCNLYGHDATALSLLTVYGDDDDGSMLPITLVNQSLYAFEVVGGPWTDDGVNSYLVEVSNDNGTSWAELADFDNLLCSQSADGDHHLIYVRGGTGAVWRFRAADGDDDFTNNGASIQVKVYAGNTSIDPYVTCDDSYTNTKVSLSNNQRTVAGNSTSGTTIPTIVSGKRYAVEITGEAAWYDQDNTSDPLYAVEISDDGGSTWEPLETYGEALCVSMVGNDGRFKIYFDAVSSTYKLRVADGDDDFLSNTGQVYFNLYTSIDSSNPGSWDNTPDPEWVVACSQRYSRPNSLFQMVGIVPVPRVGDWIEYGKNSIIYYFAWCPEHTAALTNMGEEIYMDKEPMASLTLLFNLMKDLRDIAEATIGASGGTDPALESMEPDLFSNVSSEASGGTSSYTMPANPVDLLVVGNVDRSSNNVLFGGELDLTTINEPSGGAGDAAYKELCNDSFYNLFGIGTTAFCSVMSVLRTGTKVMTWVLLVLDVIITAKFVLSYFPDFVGRMWEVITGEKRSIKRWIKKAVS